MSYNPTNALPENTNHTDTTRSQHIIKNCKTLIEAYENGQLGQTIMPEDSYPDFLNLPVESKLIYFTLPMSLNYQRDSYKLWSAALDTFNDPKTKFLFNFEQLLKHNDEDIRNALLKYKTALQPNKHIYSWITISRTIFKNWGTIENMFKEANFDCANLILIIQKQFKKDFPYLSGPKIFNYWLFIMSTYAGISLKNRHLIEIAPDTHVIKCSIKLGVISEAESLNLTTDQISTRWRNLLSGTGIEPIDLHSPL
jgi:hypothetical protein